MLFVKIKRDASFAFEPALRKNDTINSLKPSDAYMRQ